MQDSRSVFSTPVENLSGSEGFNKARDFQALFICLVAGRLGLRAGEITHLNTEWFDWDRKLLQIPQHEPCSCGYCRRQAAQEASHCDDITEAETEEARWHVNYSTLPRSGLLVPRLLRVGLPVSVSERAGTGPTAVPDSAGDFPLRVVRSVPLLPNRYSATADDARLLSSFERPPVFRDDETA